MQKLICCICFLLCLWVDCDCAPTDSEYSIFERDYYAGPSVKPVTRPAATVTEGPHWDNTNQYLLYTDVIRKKLNRYDPKTGRVTSANVGGLVTVCIPVNGVSNSFVCGINRNLTLVEWDGVSSEPSAMRILLSIEEDKHFNNMGDAKVDDKGVLWIGTFNYNKKVNESLAEGGLYHYCTKTCRLVKDLGGISQSNGIAWNKDSTKMYYIDSPTRKVFGYDYDLETSSISNQQTVFDLDEYRIPGVPDGMTIDTDDNLWVGIRGGWRVIRIDPRTGKLLYTVMIPVYHVFSVTFGGPDRDVLYVTTGSFGVAKEHADALRVHEPYTGSVFAVYGLKAQGRPANNVNICL